MAQQIFHFVAQLGKSVGISVRNEDGIVAESKGTHWFKREFALNGATEIFLHLSVSREDHGAAKSRFAVRDSFHFVKQMK